MREQKNSKSTFTKNGAGSRSGEHNLSTSSKVAATLEAICASLPLKDKCSILRLCEGDKNQLSHTNCNDVCETNLNVAWYNKSNILKEDDFTRVYKISVIFVKNVA